MLLHEGVVDEHPAVPDGGESERDLPCAVGCPGAGQFERGAGPDGCVAAEVEQAGGAAVLAEDLGAVGIEEPDQRPWLPGRRVGDLVERQLGDALLHDGTQRVRHDGVRQRGPQGVERADRPLWDHRR